MREAQGGYAFLEELKRKNAKPQQSFDDFEAFLEQKARTQGAPLTGQFELTPLCNFQCRMCYVQLTREQMTRPLLTAEQWKSLMSQAAHAGMLRATLTGGECLTYPDFKVVFEHLQSLGCQVALLTNGALLNEEWAAYFLRHRPHSIHITLYGDGEDAYERVTGRRAFEAVTENIRRLQEAGLYVDLSVTPSRFLGEDVFATIRKAKELCQFVSVNTLLSPPRQETGRVKDDAELDEEFYLRILKFTNELNGVEATECPAEKLPQPGGPQLEGVARGLLCGGGRSGFFINWRGIMSPCAELDMLQTDPLRDGFDACWRGIHQAAEEWPRPMACQGCAYASLCETCAGRLLQYSRPGERSQALCEKTVRLVRQGVSRIPACE